MAEAEDVIIDAAQHVTAYAQALWQRNRKPAGARSSDGSTELAARTELLLAAVFGRHWPLRIAQKPAPANLLARILERKRNPLATDALPATDGIRIWLPAIPDAGDPAAIAERYRIVALQQAMRAHRGSAAAWAQAASPLEQDLVLILEADAADADLLRWLPGIAGALSAMRAAASAARPALATTGPDRPLEEELRARLGRLPDLSPSTSAQDSLQQARSRANALMQHFGGPPPGLRKDGWTGELRLPAAETRTSAAGDATTGEEPAIPRSARLTRTPRVRAAREDEDDAAPGAWMVQASRPHEIAADPMGLQRPTDHDAETAAEDFAEDLSDLGEARLVSSPSPPREVLLGDDPDAIPVRSLRPTDRAATQGRASFNYPEWDWRAGGYRDPGARVHRLPAAEGDAAWVRATLQQHHSLLAGIRRGFEMLKAERLSLRRQLDGDEIDLEAVIEARADYSAGLPMAQTLYRATRAARRSLAITLLVDISGSTDSWVSAGRRIIDVEREALLLVCIALDCLGEPYSVLAFSGQGAGGVRLRELKRFDEPYGEAVALRIAALEPEHYTRAGAALRHAAAGLMQQAARHRLLLLLSDGKPNDDDEYEGRYGVEDVRQAVVEARLQGISPFCLTIDRFAAAYLGRVFGAHHYALLRDPERLPQALLGWIRRLVLR